MSKTQKVELQKDFLQIEDQEDSKFQELFHDEVKWYQDRKSATEIEEMSLDLSPKPLINSILSPRSKN